MPLKVENTTSGIASPSRSTTAGVESTWVWVGNVGDAVQAHSVRGENDPAAGWNEQACPERATLLLSLASAITPELSTKAWMALPRKSRLPDASAVTMASAPPSSPGCEALPTRRSIASWKAPSAFRSSKKVTTNGPTAAPSPWLRIAAATEPETASVWPSVESPEVSTLVTTRSACPPARSARPESKALLPSSDSVTNPCSPPTSSATIQTELAVVTANGRTRTTSSNSPGRR